MPRAKQIRPDLEYYAAIRPDRQDYALVDRERGPLPAAERYIQAKAEKIVRLHGPEELIRVGRALEEQGATLRKIEEIGKRHKAKPNETVSRLLRRAATAGDEEAKNLIASGVCEQQRLEM
jgi:hypothetical protein